MIRLLNVTASRRRQPLFFGITASFPRLSRIGILGAAGAGKSTLIRMIAGTEQPDGGSIIRSGHLSWPLGLAAGFHPDLSGPENVAHLARINGLDADFCRAFCARFTGLSSAEPLRNYTPAMRARLAFAFSFAAPFNTYLADEATGTGDEAFRARCDAMLDARLKQSGLILTSRRAATLKRYCDTFYALARGTLIPCQDIEAAEAIVLAAPPANKEPAPCLTP